MEKIATGRHGSADAAEMAATAQVDAQNDAYAAAEGGRAGFLGTGHPGRVLQAARDMLLARRLGVLALVLETEGSTYAGTGSMALFAGDVQVGWLSGGCLEPELARRAAQAEAAGRIEWIEIDTREDEDLLSGSALGCRGRLRIALLPLRCLAGVEVLFDGWLEGGATLHRAIGADGTASLRLRDEERVWHASANALPWKADTKRWRLPLPRPPEALLFGAGPETPMLLHQLHELGWRTTLAERRARWRGLGAQAHRHVDSTPATALSSMPMCDAVLVMHHNFELDREALESLADAAVPFVGLLGPQRRRDDLFKLMTPVQRAALMPRLRSPVGLDLGGKGPEAIALSIAAQLQAWRAQGAGA